MPAQLKQTLPDLDLDAILSNIKGHGFGLGTGPILILTQISIGQVLPARDQSGRTR